MGENEIKESDCFTIANNAATLVILSVGRSPKSKPEGRLPAVGSRGGGLGTSWFKVTEKSGDLLQ